MVEVSETGLKEEEVELDLGLSIGGSFHRSEKPIQPDSKPNGFELHLKDQHQAWEGSFEDAQRESSSMAVMDPQTKREIHALRRLEAKKKREEKQQHKRAMREPEPEHQQRAFKREKTDPQRLDGGVGVSEWSNVNLNLNGTAATSMAPLHHPYAYVQLNNNAYAYPCVVPWMAPCGKKKNAGQPGVHCKGFRPFSGNGYGSEPNSERDCGDKKAKSDGSSMCSSSVVSDYQSSSHEGRGSSDSHSHSVQSKENNIRSQPEESASSHSTRSENLNGQSSTNHIVTQPHDQTKFKELEHSTMEDKAVQGDKKKPLSNDKKPPKPLPQTSSSSLSLSPALPKMPYVSTTGNGPNGKRVNGFLYRYSDSEVSIVCVCHGSTFSPAGFVQHAGGTDTSHPERHITVIRPAFG